MTSKTKPEELSLEEKFYYFLRHAPEITAEELAALSSNTPVIEEAFKELDRFYWSEQEFGSYEDREKAIWDNRASLDSSRKEDMQQGLQKGREEGMIKAVKGMYQAGADISFICKASGLLEEEVRKILADCPVA